MCSALRKLRGDFFAVFSILIMGREEIGADLFTLMASDRTQRNRMKLSHGRLRLDIRKRFFSLRVLEQTLQGSGRSTKTDRVQ